MLKRISLVCLLLSRSSIAFLGTELGPLLQLVAGQVQEIEKLAETVGVAKDQREILIKLNHGIDETISQIQSIQSIIDRAQGLDPRSIRTISELNQYLGRLKEAKRSIDDVLLIKVEASKFAVDSAALQSETTYLMGQEMIATGANLAQESRSASPGRAAQIQAASSSAQMLAKGVELQTLAQIAQLQALSLELERSKLEREIESQKSARSLSGSAVRNRSKLIGNRRIK